MSSFFPHSGKRLEREEKKKKNEKKMLVSWDKVKGLTCWLKWYDEWRSPLRILLRWWILCFESFSLECRHYFLLDSLLKSYIVDLYRTLPKWEAVECDLKETKWDQKWSLMTSFSSHKSALRLTWARWGITHYSLMRTILLVCVSGKNKLEFLKECFFFVAHLLILWDKC